MYVSQIFLDLFQFHTIIAHSESVSSFGSKLDYLGITFLITGSFFPSLYYRVLLLSASTKGLLDDGYFSRGSSHISRYLRSGFCSHSSRLTTGSPGPHGGIFIFINAKDRYIRATLFVAMGLSAIFPIGHLLTLLPVSTQQMNLTVDETVT